MNIFSNEIEQQAIQRIQKFAKIAQSMGFDVCLGFSGGKDSQVCYDLCKRSGIKFKAHFNHAFESSVTLKFIRTEYPEVIWRRDHNYGFIQNIWQNHNGLLPTVTMAYCCSDYKHNIRYVEKCSIVGVRKAESAKRSKRTAFEAKNKTTIKKNKDLINAYFEEHCQSVGTASIIQLKPIVDWADSDVWDYIYKYNLPINPEYKNAKRVGCVVCPKADIKSNHKYLISHPRLIDAFIKARQLGDRSDWIINKGRPDEIDCSNDKCYYICRWLNHSFMPFTKNQEKLYQKVKEKYNSIRKESCDE